MQPKLDEDIVRLLNGRLDAYPTKLEQRYTRVLNRIIELWYTQSFDDYITELLVDTRGGRQGFPPEVASEIFALSKVRTELYSSRKQQPGADNPWGDESDFKRNVLDSREYEYSPKNFIKAVETGNKKAVSGFLNLGMDVDIRDERGWSPLMMSSFNGNEEVALMLIRSGADIHARDKGGYGPLHWAAFNGFGNVVKMLIENGADVNAMSDHGWTPLLQAVTRGQLEASKQLIAGGAKVNLTTKDGWAPLHKAANNGHTEIVRLLLDKGAKRDIEYQDGTTPLKLATKHKHAAIMAMLSEEK